MVTRPASLALALMLAGASCAVPPVPEGEGEALACPQVTKVSAWRNRMPPTPEGGAPLIVQVTFDRLTSWQLERRESGDAKVLALDLVPANREPAIATGFRERPRDVARQRVVIFCQDTRVGGENTITDAY